MWQKVRELKAMELKELMPNKNIFCHWCFYFTTGLQKRGQPYAGWGGHSPDICWHRPESSPEMKEFMKEKERKEDLVKGSPPNPNWGSEPKKLKVADVKSSGEEAEEKKKKRMRKEMKRRRKRKGREQMKQRAVRVDKPKKEKKDERKKRKSSNSSEIEKRAKKAPRDEDELL